MKVESAHVKLAPGGLLTEDYNLLCHKNYRLQDDGNSIKPKTHPFF